MKVETPRRTLDILELPVSEFFADRFNPAAGEHTAIIGPTGSGKTTLGLQIVAVYTLLHSFLTGCVLVLKPHKGPRSAGRKSTGDHTVATWTAKLGGKVVRSWPPRPSFGELVARLFGRETKPAFFVLWPTSEGDPAVDIPEAHRVMRGALIDCYQSGDTVVFADEAAGLVADLKLEPELKQTLQRGRSRNNSAVLASQRPKYVPREMLSESRHFFLARMSDEGEYERLGEISGGRLDRKEIIAILAKLKKHWWLYMHPPSGTVCILRPDAPARGRRPDGVTSNGTPVDTK